MHFARLFPVVFLLLFPNKGFAAVNVDPQDEGFRYAYGENVGWLDLKPGGSGGPGVEVSSSSLTGFMWGENVGWISLSCVSTGNCSTAEYGVLNDGAGNLSGSAWGENVGWINFAPAGGGVFINPVIGVFTGYAWGENIGWINFAPSGRGVKTSWLNPDACTDADADGYASQGRSCGPADCNDGDALERPDQTWYEDADGDGYSTGFAVQQCLRPVDHKASSELTGVTGDCNDQDAAVNPGTAEVCDGIDDNCDGQVDEGLTTAYFRDADGDTYGDPANSTQACSQPQGYVADGTDCDDSDSYERPNQAWYKDEDNDGYSDGASAVSCLRPTGYKTTSELTATSGDCNDRNPAITVVQGICGIIDPDGTDSQYAWGENAGWINLAPSQGPGVNVTDTGLFGSAWGENIGWINLSPAAGGVDNDGAGNLSGSAWGENVGWINFAPSGGGVYINPVTGVFSGYAWGENIGWINFAPSGRAVKTSWLNPGACTDADADGYAAQGRSCGPADCNDGDALEHPGQTWYEDGDGDGYSTGVAVQQCPRPLYHKASSELTGVTGDCNDQDAAVNPGIAEVCDGIDNNCDGQVDEGLTTAYFRDADGDTYGDPANSTQACSQPQGYVADGTDCDDSDAYQRPNQTWYKDEDNDGYSDGANALSCLRPTGYKTTSELTATSGDCNDRNPVITVVQGICGIIDPNGTDSQYAWGENVGWINLAPSQGPGVNVTDTGLFGSAWGENIGWINLSPAAGGVHNDGAGNLSGLAWGENVGWVNFAPAGGGVYINPVTGVFGGYAWGENIGWINFAPSGSGVKTSWLKPGACTDADADGYAAQGRSCGPADCNDGDALEHPGQTWYEDGDGDGYSTGVAVQQCPRALYHKASSELTGVTGDCNDQDAAVNPGIAEVCDGIDNNCDGQVDEGLTTAYFRDADGDTCGDPADSTQACSQPQGYVADGTDCDDSDPYERPNQTWYKDEDNDGYSDGASAVSCLRPTGYKTTSELTATSGDCNDRNPVITVVQGICGIIDPNGTDSQYAWGENVGWINLAPSQGPGVNVTDTGLFGSAWGENIGWINLSPAAGGVDNDGAGNLSGLAWGENVGWVNFAPAGGGVYINPVTGVFSGYAWGENIGWINFRPSNGGVTTSWRPSVQIPIVSDQTVVTDEDTQVGITLVGQDPGGRPLTFVFAGGPFHGALSGAPPNLTYTPDYNYHGQDSFAFRASNGASTSNTATVSIIVNPLNDPPVANDRSVTTDQDTPVAVVLSGSDPDGQSLTYTVLDGPASGTLSGAAPNLTYSPSSGFFGTDSFTFRVSDGQLESNVATVSVTVNPVYVHVTVQTVPAGLSFSVDGISYSGSQTFPWNRGSSHTIATASPQGNGGTRHVFAGWSDGGEITHTVTVPALPVTHTATFEVQYLLSLNVAPAGAGSIVADPPSADGYFSSGTVVQLTAAASAGYEFFTWGVDLTGSGNPQSLAMGLPRSVAGNFRITTEVAVSCPSAAQPYIGAPIEPCTALATGVGGYNQALTVTYADNTNVGTATASAVYAGDANHTSSSGSATFEIAKAKATATAGSYSGQYDGDAHAPSACTVAGDYTGDLSCTNDPASVGPDVSTGDVSAVVSGTGLANFDITLVKGSYSIGQAPSTVAVTCPGSVTYNGTTQSPCTAKASGVGMSDVDVTGSLVYTNNTDAGVSTASASYAGDMNHTGSSGTQSFTIAKAEATVTAGSYVGQYDGDAHAPSACTVAGAYTGDLSCTNDPASVGPDVSAGDVSAVVSGTGLANFDITLVKGSYSIDEAPSTVVVTCPGNVTYNGTAQSPCTAKASGVGMSDVDMTASLVYTNNIEAGTATASAVYAGDMNHTGSSGTQSFTIAIASTTTTAAVSASSVRYMDPVTLSARIVPFNTGSPLAGSVSFRIGGADYGTVPAGPIPGDEQGALQATLTTQVSELPGGYTVTATFSSTNANYASSSGTVPLLVTPREAGPYVATGFYTGDLFAWTTGQSSSTATVTMTAMIKDDNVPEGDIRAARVTFFFVNGTSLIPISGAKDIPVGLVDSTDHKLGTASAIVQLNIGSANAQGFKIAVGIGGGYTNNPWDALSETIVTVAKPIPGGFIVGGGTLKNTSASAGLLRGAVDQLTDFSFDVRYNKTQTNPQGKVQVTVRSYYKPDGTLDSRLHSYVITSNAISLLAVTTPKASFSSKANLVEQLGDGTTVVVEGGSILQLSMNGATKTLGITLQRKAGGLWFSSNWNPTTGKTVEQVKFGGDLSVR